MKHLNVSLIQAPEQLLLIVKCTTTLRFLLTVVLNAMTSTFLNKLTEMPVEILLLLTPEENGVNLRTCSVISKDVNLTNWELLMNG